jgi:predicted nucleic acid-binding protein
MSASLCFVDTNVFAYSYADGLPDKQQRADVLIDRAILEGTGVISFQVIQEFFSVAFRRFRSPISATEAEQFLANTFSQFRVVHSSHSLYQRALELYRLHSLSWYDSLIVAAALEADCGTLYSEDLQHGQKFGSLEIQNPFV